MSARIYVEVDDGSVSSQSRWYKGDDVFDATHAMLAQITGWIPPACDALIFASIRHSGDRTGAKEWVMRAERVNGKWVTP